MGKRLRKQDRRRNPVSSFVNGRTAETLEDTADYLFVSRSELVARILVNACAKGLPSTADELDKVLPLDPEWQTGDTL